MNTVNLTKALNRPHLRGAPSKHRQHGDFLLESLIGLLLMAIIGMGVTFVTSKVNSSQKDMRLQEIVVNNLRAALVRNGMETFDVCTADLDFTLPNGEQVTVTTQGCNASTTATINSVDIADVPRPIFLMASSESIDQIVVGGTWQ